MKRSTDKRLIGMTKWRSRLEDTNGVHIYMLYEDYDYILQSKAFKKDFSNDYFRFRRELEALREHYCCIQRYNCEYHVVMKGNEHFWFVGWDRTCRAKTLHIGQVTENGFPLATLKPRYRPHRHKASRKEDMASANSRKK